jgi:hypothetical protein
MSLLWVGVAIGFAVGVAVMDAGRRFQEKRSGSAPRLRVVGEGPAENCANALQVLMAFVWLDDRDRAGDRGLEIVNAAIKRIERALKQLKKKAA